MVMALDTLFLLLSVWLLVVNVLLLCVSFFESLPPDTANNIYNAYIYMVAVLASLQSLVMGAAGISIWRRLSIAASLQKSIVEDLLKSQHRRGGVHRLLVVHAGEG